MSSVIIFSSTSASGSLVVARVQDGKLRRLRLESRSLDVCGGPNRRHLKFSTIACHNSVSGRQPRYWKLKSTNHESHSSLRSSSNLSHNGQSCFQGLKSPNVSIFFDGQRNLRRLGSIRNEKSNSVRSKADDGGERTDKIAESADSELHDFNSPLSGVEDDAVGDGSGSRIEGLDSTPTNFSSVSDHGFASMSGTEWRGSTKKIVRSVVRVLSGATLRDKVTMIQVEERRKKRSWLRNPLRFLYQTDPPPMARWQKQIAACFRRAETDFFAFSRQLGKYVMIMSGTGAILVAGMELGGGSPQEQGVLGFSWLTGVVVGSMIGAGQVLKEHARAKSRNVVITGSTRGLGRAMAREFLRNGDNVVITSRDADTVYKTVEEFREEIRENGGGRSTMEAQMELFGLPSPKKKTPRVVGIPCDVSNSNDVRALVEFAVQEFGTVDLWVNNAGVNKGFRPLLDFETEEVEQIVGTNLVGSVICTREAIKVMQNQKKGGHVFNMDGAGSGGSSTPLTAVYGATKCGLRQLSASLVQEVQGTNVGIHTASPGMVLTDLLLSGASLQNKKMFNFICEQPETVARALVPNMRLVTGTGKAVNYLTPARIVFAIVSLWIRRGRYFDKEGRAVYAAEAERLRLWAEGRQRSPVTAAMELVPSGTWVSILSSSVICAYLILSSASSAANGNLPGI